jgi:hypothetical protein
VLFPETLLNRVVLPRLGYTLDRLDRRTLGLDREHGATLRRQSIDVDNTRATLARVASNVRTRQSQLVSKIVNKQGAWFNVSFALDSVDRYAHGCLFRTLRKRIRHSAQAPF